MSPEAIALLAAISYALFTATPLVATLISLSARTVTLWTTVFLTGGIPDFLFPALVVFVVLGILQSAVVAVVSLLGAIPYLLARSDRGPVWHPKGLMHFAASGFFEAVGALLSLMALSNGRVVVVSPIVATTPLWNLLIAIVFLRGREEINRRTIAGTVCVVVGSVAIAWGK
jgi:uncharacterized membrane protein